MTRILGASAFGAAALVLLAGAGLFGWRGLVLRDPLRLAFAVILLGLTVALGYEAFAFGTRLDPTISYVVSGEFLTHPVGYLAVFLPVMVLGGALAQHFTASPHVFRWSVFAAGAIAYVLGGVVTWRTGWVP